MAREWTSLPDMPEERYFHATVATLDGKLVCAGGRDASGTTLKSVVMFDFSTQAWTSLPDMPEERWCHTMVGTLDGKKLVCAGGRDDSGRLKSVVMFDFSTQAWTSLPDMPEARVWHTMAATPDWKKLVCAGGRDASNTTLKSVVMFDFSTQAWTSLPDMPEERIDHTMAATPDGKKLVCAGGRGGRRTSDTAVKSVVMFEFSTQAWTSLPDMPEERYFHTMVATPDGKKLVCAGGDDASHTKLKSVVVFDFSTQAWTSLPDMPVERAAHTMAATLDGKKLVCAGGGDATGTILKSVVAFTLDMPAALPSSSSSSSSSSPTPSWDQRGAKSRDEWMAFIAHKPSGTFVVRPSKADPTATTSQVVGTLTAVNLGGTTAQASSLFHKRIHTVAGGGCQLAGSAHAHASLEALVAFYQDPAYVTSSKHVDVPATLIAPSGNAPAGAGGVGGGGGSSAADAIYEELWWRNDDVGGAAAAAPTASVGEDVYEQVDGSSAAAAKAAARKHRIVEEESNYGELAPYNPMKHVQMSGIPLVGFTKAMAALNSVCEGNVAAQGRKALMYASKHPHMSTVQRPGAEKLTVANIAALRMYTMETDFYKRMNQELGGYLKGEQHASVEAFLPITKLLAASMEKLPPVTNQTLFRGVNMHYAKILHPGVKVGDSLVHQFSMHTC
eukprot:gene14756-3735_t